MLPFTRAPMPGDTPPAPRQAGFRLFCCVSPDSPSTVTKIISAQPVPRPQIRTPAPMIQKSRLLGQALFYNALGHQAREFTDYPHVLDFTIRGLLWAGGHLNG